MVPICVRHEPELFKARSFISKHKKLKRSRGNMPRLPRRREVREFLRMREPTEAGQVPFPDALESWQSWKGDRMVS